ncbi:MAG: hypothetical protein ACR2PS_16805, partial [Pseudomonadales bacterium]
TDAEYDEYRFVDPIGTTCGAVNSTCDISNIGHFPTASDANASLGVSYEFAPFSFGTLSARLDVAYSDGYQHGTIDAPFDAFTEAQSYTLVNGRITLADVAAGSQGRLRFSVWGQNLTDEQYREYGITAFSALGFAGAVYNEPRSYGLDVVYEFE